MICPKCLTERKESEFYGKEECYKCVYNSKIISKGKSTHCKICGKVLPHGRRINCSEECARKSQDTQMRSYWTKLI